MMRTRMSVETRGLVDVGLKAIVELRTTPVTLSCAVALLDLVSTTVEAVIEEAQERENWGDDFVLVPVVELQTGSMKGIISFLVKKKDEFATQVVSGVISGVAVAWLTVH